MADHSNIPEFGNWENGDNVPYTVYFEKARKGRNTGKMINPNDPQENPELFSKTAPEAHPKPPPPKLVRGPEEPIVREQVRPTHERRRSRENSEFRHVDEPPANENLNRRNAHGGGRGPGPNHVRPIRQSVGSDQSFDKSPLHRSYESSHGTTERARMRPANRDRETPNKGAAVPKFGEWDEKNPSSGDGYTHIFNKVREERQTGSVDSPKRVSEPSYPPRKRYDDDGVKSCCCFPWGRK